MDWEEVAARLSRLEPPFPHETVAEVRRHWDDWAHHFIEVIKRIAGGDSPYRDEAGEVFDGLFCFATWFVTEKRDTRAYAPLVRACHCPAERAEELFSDDLTEGLARMFAGVCDGDLEPLKKLAGDNNAAMWCRVAAIDAMVIRVLQGDGAREPLLEWLSDFCRSEAERMKRAGVGYGEEQNDLLTWAVDFMGELGPAALIDQIRTWFAEGLIDPDVRGLRSFEKLAQKSTEACLEEARQDKFNQYISDVVTGMAWWACFQEGSDEDPEEPAWLDRLVPDVGGARLLHGEGTFKREMPKVGRNDPCPCGSGKKFKKCCGQEGSDNSEGDNGSGAVQRSIDWLMRHYEEEVRETIHSMLVDGIDVEDEEAFANLDEEAWQMIQSNMLESLLAEGLIWDQDAADMISVPALLLGRGGPALMVREREWIEKLARHPLRLFEVTETVPGIRMTLCDALDQEALPVVVEEKSGSRSAHAGMKLGARILPVGDHYQLSGAVYPFSDRHVPALMADLHEDVDELAEEAPELLPEALADTIRVNWLLQYLRPAPLPTLVDTHSGDLLLFISDCYRVRNWSSLENSIKKQQDIDGNREGGWSRIMECEDGLIRRRMTIEPAQDGADTITISYRTMPYAEEGRPWFETLAGDAIEFVDRDIKDPKVSMMLGGLGGKPPEPANELPPDVLAEIIETTLRRSYAHWADEPIPALQNKTPRQAIQTAAGLERVKGLLRSYEEREQEVAAQQGRREISYDFLWAQLGLLRR